LAPSADEYLEGLRKRLEGEGFTLMDEPRVGVYDLPLVAYNIDDPHGKPGLRKYFSAEVLRIIVATAMGPMESSQVEDFSLTVTKHVLEEWRKDKWGGGYGIECFPVVVCRSLSEDLKTWIRGYVAPKHWQASELPVLASLNDRELYFCEKTPMWGGLMWGGLRKFVRGRLGFEGLDFGQDSSV
jgi:hypothetical protein